MLERFFSCADFNNVHKNVKFVYIKYSLKRSLELINYLYKHPCVEIDFVVRDCQIHRNTARTRLEALVEIGILKKEKIGKENFYINVALYDVLMKQ